MTDTPMTQAGLDVYGRKGLVSCIPLGDAATFARRLRIAIERRKKRFIYPGFTRSPAVFPASRAGSPPRRKGRP